MGWAMAALCVQPVCLSVGACIILCMRPCPEKFVKIIRSFHDSMQEQVIDDGEVSGLFDIAMVPSRALCLHHCCSASSFP